MLTREFVGRTFGQNWHHIDLFVERAPFFWHYHPEFELTLTCNGHGVRYIGGDVSAFGELDLALVGANQAHTWDAKPRDDGALQRIQVVFFTREWLERLAQEGLPELTSFVRWLERIRQGAVFGQSCILRLLPVFERLRVSRDLARLSCLLEIFDALPRDPEIRYLDTQGQARNNDRRLDAALVFMQENFRKAIRLVEIARAASISEATLKRLFRQRLNLSVTELLIQLRIGQACNLLISSELPLPLIAEESGFPNASHFYRQFKRLRGISPGLFRRRHHLSLQASADQPPTEGFRTSEGHPRQALND